MVDAEVIERDDQRRSPWRWLKLIAILFVLLLFVAFFLRVSTPNTQAEIGFTYEFAPGSITPFYEQNFYLVRLEDGSWLALFARATHPASRQQGCYIRWREEFSYDNRQGWFLDECSGSIYDRDGSRVGGPTPRDMDSFPVKVEDGRVFVDTGRLICGKGPRPPGGLDSQCNPIRPNVGYGQ